MTELRTVGTVIEIWVDGKCIGTIEASKGPGVRIASEHEMLILSNKGEGIRYDTIPAGSVEVRMGVLGKGKSRKVRRAKK